MSRKLLYFSTERFFGNIYRRKRHIESRSKGIHGQMEFICSSDLISFEKELQSQYKEVFLSGRYQKSRKNWVKLGDRNTSFFPPCSDNDKKETE